MVQRKINRGGCERRLSSHYTVYRKGDGICGVLGCLAWGDGALATAKGVGRTELLLVGSKDCSANYTRTENIKHFE
jgi:hypothetical protein